MKNRARPLAFLITVFLTSPTFGEEAPPSWKGNIEVSYVQTSGNTDSLTLFSSVKAERFFERSKWLAEMKSLYSEQDEAISDNSWFGRLKYDFNLTPRTSFHALGSLERDKLKGIRFRYRYQAGVGYYFLKNPEDTLKGEVSAGYVKEDAGPPASDREFPTGRAFGEFIHVFTEKTRFEQTVEYLPNLKRSKDYMIISDSSLITHLMGNFALKASFTLTYDNLPPETFSDTDRIYKVSLLYTF